MAITIDTITLPAMEIRQSKGRKLYSFAVDGKKIPLRASLASGDRIRRSSKVTSAPK